MTDANKIGEAPEHRLYLREEGLREAIELLFYAYRDFTSDPDAILAEFGFGRAHHRVIHFVGGNPGMSVSNLLSILKITKQSLARVLGELVRQGYVEQRTGARDRRQRLLYLTETGQALEARLSDPQRRRMMTAFREAGAEAVIGFRKVLVGLIDEADRTDVLHAVETGK